MPSAPDPHARRRNANERHQQAFLVQAATTLAEFAELLGEEPEAQESVAFELRQLARTAETIGLASVARASSDAADELENQSIGARALRRVANAIRHVGGRLRFGPLVVVGADEATRRSLLADVELCCEPLRLYSDLQDFAGGLHTEQPTCVALPLDAVDAVMQLVSRERFPVLVHGPANAWEARSAAMAAGAHGFLGRPFTLGDLTRFARWRSRPAEEVLEVLLLADPDPSRDALAKSMEQVGLAAIVAQDASELAVALERGTPKAVVLGARVGGATGQVHTALGLAQLVRSHPRCNHLPILVTGRPDDPAALRNLGVDDVMRTDAQPLQAAQRVRDRIVRVVSLPWERDPVSGLHNRLGVLDALDAELSRVSRSHEVLSVVLVELDGLRASIDAFGPRVLYAARQLLVRLFRAHLRRADLHGELDRGELLVALPNCERDTALARVMVVAERFRDESRRDPELRNVHVVLGAADTREGLNTVALRAERDLRATR